MRHVVRIPMPGVLDGLVVEAFSQLAPDHVFHGIGEPPHVEISCMEIGRLVPRNAVVFDVAPISSMVAKNKINGESQREVRDSTDIVSLIRKSAVS